MACYYEDSEGEKNYLSQDEDLEDASKYKKDKRLKQLACYVERRDGQQIQGRHRNGGHQKEDGMEGVNSDGNKAKGIPKNIEMVIRQMTRLAIDKACKEQLGVKDKAEDYSSGLLSKVISKKRMSKSISKLSESQVPHDSDQKQPRKIKFKNNMAIVPISTCSTSGNLGQ